MQFATPSASRRGCAEAGADGLLLRSPSSNERAATDSICFNSPACRATSQTITRAIKRDHRYGPLVVFCTVPRLLAHLAAPVAALAPRFPRGGARMRGYYSRQPKGSSTTRHAPCCDVARIADQGYQRRDHRRHDWAAPPLGARHASAELAELLIAQMPHPGRWRCSRNPEPRRHAQYARNSNPDYYKPISLDDGGGSRPCGARKH